MPDEPNSRSWSKRSALGWIVLVVFLYVLSVGPAVRFGVSSVMLSGMTPIHRVGRLWKPVLALEETPVRPLFRAYMKLWGVTYQDAVDVPVVE